MQAQEDNKPYDPDPANPASALQFQTYTQQVAQYRSTVNDYDQKIAALQTAINGYNEQAAYYRTQIDIASDVRTMRTQLQQMQVGSKLDTESAESTLVSFRPRWPARYLPQPNRNRICNRSRRRRKRLSSNGTPMFRRSWLPPITGLSTAQQALAKAKLNDQLVVLTAPEDSIVQSVAGVSPGAVMQTGDTLMADGAGECAAGRTGGD